MRESRARQHPVLEGPVRARLRDHELPVQPVDRHDVADLEVVEGPDADPARAHDQYHYPQGRR